MKIQIRRIQPDGLEIHESFPVDMIGLAQIDNLEFIAPFEVSARVFRADDEIVAKLTAKSHYKSLCCRCLEEVKQDWAAAFTLSFDAKNYTEFIEIDEDIRQELILNLPLRVLCDTDCKGLCVECGVNLNKKTCDHEHIVASGQ